ncbi:hypothetical protein NUSPORA_01154 [Nucleospora cyclopteri]
MRTEDQNSLKAEIERKLEVENFKNILEMRNHLKNIKFLIVKYEQVFYGNFTEERKGEIRCFRRRITEILKKNKNLINEETTQKEEKDDEGIETLRMINKQIALSESNQRILEKGTIKLQTLDLTNADITDEIKKANKKVSKFKEAEKNQIRRIKMAYFFLLLISFLIICDKMYIRLFKRNNPQIVFNNYKSQRNLRREESELAEREVL